MSSLCGAMLIFSVSFQFFVCHPRKEMYSLIEEMPLVAITSNNVYDIEVRN